MKIFDLNTEEKRKSFLIYSFSIVALAGLMFFSIYGIEKGPVYINSLMTFFFLTLSNIILLYFLKKIKIASYITSILLFIVIIVIYYITSKNYTAFYWYYIYPAAVITLLGVRTGSVFSMLIISLAIIIFQIDHKILELNGYTEDNFFRFVFTYFILYFLILFLEYSRKKIFKLYNLKVLEIKSENEKLSKLNIDLSYKTKIIEEKELRLESIINNQSNALIITDFNETITFANLNACILLEESLDILLRTCFIDFVENSEKQSFLKEEKKIKKGINSKHQVKITTKKGNAKVLEIYGSPDYDVLGKITGSIVIFRDITDEVESVKKIALLNKEISESEERYRSIIESTTDIIVETDKYGKITFVNERHEEVFGRQKQEIIGKYISEFVPKREILRYSNLAKEILIHKEVNNFETFILNIKMQEIPVEINSKTIFRKGQVRLLSSIRDITKRIQNRKELAKLNSEIVENEKKFRYLVENLGEGVGVMDTNETFTFANPEAERIFGVGESELENMSLSSFVSKKTLNSIKEKRKKRKKGNSSNYEIDITQPSGNIINLIVTATSMYDKNQEFIGTQGIFRDISDIKKMLIQLSEKEKHISNIHNNLTINISYAYKIQSSMLTPKRILDIYLQDYFLIFKPKDIVSGDFYYVNNINEYLIVCVGDCTGHGVAGGFLTMIGITYLHEIFSNNKQIDASLALEMLRKRFKNIFSKFENNNLDGMNVSICIFNTYTNTLQFSGAYNPIIIIRNDELKEYKATRSPIGFHYREKHFETTNIKLKNDDNIYLFSDGYYDQLNQNNLKYSKKKFKKDILEMRSKKMKLQKQILNKNLKKFQNNTEQIDDITVLGMKWEIETNILNDEN